ncbi:hypothetical protein EDI_031840 [Entamoeba dispar SAW760]|uniref:Ricin B lectin domain-containing protein n=1 Tax=Entamoeba dispar (strain ATCC PRA-260 / SAW760) TaxID=370354 RepID=B0EQP4_ENTDS|nr:uncharacterized protein EDI_031840 [Entamoeba dispar SAW760]EDR23163.1 hypothetical protein EDI_031840 [Entamoeba dispar SAW760]|eukprot:EDR23163.1 hypothetical protein EDI_031840 [Entamoeba dispar SAW760]
MNELSLILQEEEKRDEITEKEKYKYLTNALKKVLLVIKELQTINSTETQFKKELERFSEQYQTIETKLKGVPEETSNFNESNEIIEIELEIEELENKVQKRWKKENDRKKVYMVLYNNNIYQIQPVCAPTMRIDVNGESMKDGSPISLFYSNQQKNQLFKIKQLEIPGHERCIVLQCSHSKKYLGRKHNKTKPGTKVTQTNGIESVEENHWELEPVGNGSFYINCAHCNLRMDVSRGSTKNLTKIICWLKKTENTTNQQFSFINNNSEGKF